MPNSNLSTLRNLESLCKNYTQNPAFVFKSCIFDKSLYLIVLKKLSRTKTNETRKSITNHFFAKFRADKLQVVRIIDVFSFNRVVPYVTNNYESTTTYYKVGHIVHPNKYDEDIENVCSEGIHYFKSIEPAFMYHIGNFIHAWNICKIKDWYDDGVLYEEGTYIYGKKSGPWEKLHENGNLYTEVTYVNDKKSGISREWNVYGKLIEEMKYANGKLSGPWKSWYKSGKLFEEEYYVDGILNGPWYLWYENGNLCEEGTYVDGKLFGSWKIWDENGIDFEEITILE
jgi:hypothetical protein